MSARPPASSALDVVYFAGVDWGYTWQRAQQLAVRLARHGRLLYIDPLGLRSPRLGDWRRLARRVRDAVGPLSRAPSPPASLTLHRPIAYWPLPASATGHRVNGRLLYATASAWLRRGGARSPVLWAGVPSPAVLDAIRRLRAQWVDARVVYDAADDVTAFDGERPGVAEAEAALAAQADVTWAVSARLLARLRGWSPRARLLPNAADVPHFRRAVTEDLPLPLDLVGLPGPRVGYVGEVAPWVDLELVAQVADRHPRASVVLIGPVHDDARTRALTRRANVHLLGRRPYAELPAYLRHMDVCLLPFARMPLTEAASPIKLYEYLAAGRAVVSTSLPEVVPHTDVVVVAERTAFADAVSRVLEAPARPSPEVTERRLARAAANDWDQRTDVVLAALRAATPSDRRPAAG